MKQLQEATAVKQLQEATAVKHGVVSPAMHIAQAGLTHVQHAAVRAVGLPVLVEEVLCTFSPYRSADIAVTRHMSDLTDVS